MLFRSAVYGEPPPGTKVFIVTRQHKDGWQGLPQETSDIVPGKAAGQQAAATEALTLTVHMYKGSTREVQGSGALVIPANVPASALPTADEPAKSASSGGERQGEKAGNPGSRLRCPPFIPEK